MLHKAIHQQGSFLFSTKKPVMRPHPQPTPSTPAPTTGLLQIPLQLQSWASTWLPSHVKETWIETGAYLSFIQFFHASNLLFPLLINFQKLELLKSGESTKDFCPFGNLGNRESLFEATESGIPGVKTVTPSSKFWVGWENLVTHSHLFITGSHMKIFKSGCILISQLRNKLAGFNFLIVWMLIFV